MIKTGSFWVLMILLAGTWLGACRTQKRVTMEEVTVSAKDAGYKATAAHVWDITHTKLQLSFNMKERTAQGKAWLDMHPYFYATDSLELDAKGMEIDSVKLIADGQIFVMPFTYADDKLKLKLVRTYTAADEIHLYIKYTAMPYGKPSGGSKAISDDRGLYFINTDNAIPGKPAQIWTQGETEANSHWMPTIDKPNERFTTELELIVPDSFTTLSNGHRAGQIPLPGGMRMDKWKMDKEIQAYAVTFAIGNYVVVKDEWRGKEVSYYVEPDYAPYARKMFANTPEMMEYFSGITGIPYPWNKYSQVVVRDYVSGAMENTTATTFGEYINQDFRQMADRDYEYIVAHELFHQWFGDYVTAESWSNITVNESFANYGEVLWRRHKYGNAAAEDGALSELWNYVYGQAQSNDPALVRFHYKDKEDVFDRVSYQKGGAILGYLHGLIGDSAFFKSMNLYLKTNALKAAEATHWRLAVEEVTGQDWNWFFNQWYYRGGHPVLDIGYNYDDAAKQLIVTVNQKQVGYAYQLPLKSWLIYGNDITVVDWDVKNKTETFTYPYKDGVKPLVVADAKHWLVGQIKYNLEPAEWLQVYKLSNDNVVNRRLALGGVVKAMDDSASRELFSLAMKDSWHTIRFLAVDNMSRLKGDKWKELWKDEVLEIAKHDANNIVRASAFDLLGDWKLKTAEQDMLQALNDSSYAVAGAALDAFNTVSGANKDTAYTIAKQMLAGNPKGDLRIAIWEIIAERGVASDADLFAKHAWEFYGPSKVDFAGALSVYLEHVITPSAFDKALSTLVTLQKTENISSYRASIATSLYVAGATYKKMVANSRSNTEQAEIQAKYDKLKNAADEMIAAETNENNVKQYKNYGKVMFGK